MREVPQEFLDAAFNKLKNRYEAAATENHNRMLADLGIFCAPLRLAVPSDDPRVEKWLREEAARRMDRAINNATLLSALEKV